MRLLREDILVVEHMCNLGSLLLQASVSTRLFLGRSAARLFRFGHFAEITEAS